MDFLRTGPPAQAFHAFGDGPAADHDDLAPLARQLGHLPTPLTDRSLIETSALIGDQARADFDDNAACVGAKSG